MFRYLTPDTPAGGNVCRSFQLPPELLPIFMGALDVLTRVDVYEPDGTMTPTEVAQAFMGIMNSYSTAEGDCLEPLGSVQWFPIQLNELADFADKWKLCDGSYFAKADYPDYWSMIEAGSYAYVWEYDTDNFTIPDMVLRFPYGTNDEPGGQGGEATHTLTSGEMPAHTHTEVTTGITGLFVAPGEVPAVIAAGAGVTGSTGGGGAHNNLPPFTQLCPYIKIKR